MPSLLFSTLKVKKKIQIHNGLNEISLLYFSSVLRCTTPLILEEKKNFWCKICGFVAVSVGTNMYDIQRPGMWLTHQLCPGNLSRWQWTGDVMWLSLHHDLSYNWTHAVFTEKFEPRTSSGFVFCYNSNYQFKLASTKMSGYSHVCKIAIGNSTNRADTEGV